MQKKYLDGKTWFPLTVQKEILAMRTEIEKNAQHAGQKFELVKQAYNEIKVAHGGLPVKHTSSCSGCILNMNGALKNWFALYDKQSPSDKRITVAPSFKPLKPTNDKGTETKTDPASPPKTDEPSYKDLLAKFNEIATPEEKDAVLKGRKTPKKDELIEYFNGK